MDYTPSKPEALRKSEGSEPRNPEKKSGERVMAMEKPSANERPLTTKQVAQDIRKVLEEHPEISLHPGRTPEQWAELVIKTGGCPCVRGRKKCPCDELLEDMECLDHCRCCLYCNARYLKLYDEVVVQRRKAKARGSSPKGRGSITSRRGSPSSAPAKG